MTSQPNPAPTYGVQSAALTGGIHVGRMNKSRTAFTDKEEATDMVLAAVAHYVERHFDGSMIADIPALGLALEVRVTPLGEQVPDQPDQPESGSTPEAGGGRRG